MLPTGGGRVLLFAVAVCCCPQGGIFSLKLQFSERYPEKPPRVRFTCDMFHPNVSNAAAPCHS